MRNCPCKTRREIKFWEGVEACAGPQILESKKHHVVRPIADMVGELEASNLQMTLGMLLSPYPDNFRLTALGLSLRATMRFLLQMAPWHPYPDVLTAEQAFSSGAAQLHCSLLHECASICLRLGQHDCRFFLRALQFATLLIETRFITHRFLIKAIGLYRDAHYDICARGHASHLGIRRPPKPHLDNIRKLIQRMEKKAVNPDAWAHEHCLTAGHEGCM